MSYTTEDKPTRPVELDGFWTDDATDGFYDESPARGFYSGGGYLAERKPFRTATPTMEPVPGADVYGAYLADGTYAADGLILAGGDAAGRLTEGKPS